MENTIIQVDHVYRRNHKECIFVCKVKGHEDRYLKCRSEVLIFHVDDGILKVFISKHKKEVCCMGTDLYYTVPGGAWNKDKHRHHKTREEKHHITAYKEAKEEAYIVVDKASMLLAGNYIRLKDDLGNCGLHGSKGEYRWKGYYTEIFVAIYKESYKGHVPKNEQDHKIKKGEFFPIDEVYNILCKEHQAAIDFYREVHNL